MASAATSHPEEAVLLIDVGGQRRRLVITKFPFTIGRAEDCDASIADFKISRQHAAVTFEAGEYFIADTGSRHGTFVNGSRCDRVKLKNNDEITLGAAGIKIIFLNGRRAVNPRNVLLTRLVSNSDMSDLEKLSARSAHSRFLRAHRPTPGRLIR